jgi:glycosyltransferase involved in cell wall biosynthesis
MRILYITINPSIASTTVAVCGWLRYLMPRGLEPVVVTPRFGEFTAWAETIGVPTYAVPLPFPDKRWPWPFLSSLTRLYRIARKHRIELIHCNEHDVYPIGQYLARLLGAPVVTTAHFTLSRGFTQWAFTGVRCPHRLFFLCNSSMRQSLEAVEGIVPADRRRICYNGLELEKYTASEEVRWRARESLGIGDRLAIGIGCALRPVKQIEHLIAVGERLADLGVQVLLAGGPVPGLEEYAEGLLAMARERLGERFTFLGWLKTPQLQELFNALDVYVNTSAEESFGVSVLESLACGCPVVGYPSVSVQEVVLPDGGQIVPQDDVEALAAAVRQWLTDRERLAAARPRARRQAERFDIAQISQQLWQEYHEVLAEYRSRPRARFLLAK